MPYTLTYYYEFENAEGATVTVLISDKESLTDQAYDTQYVSIMDEQGRVPSDAVVLKTVNNSEDKQAPVLAKRCDLRFFSSNSFDVSTFSRGEDDRWFTQVLVNTREVFSGFLVMSGNRARFMPHPNVVQLTATDNIGLLKDVPLTDDSNQNPKGKHKIIDYLWWALSKTGLQLPIKVVNNLMEETLPGAPAWDNIYLEAKTFEKSVGVSVSCYEALEIILGETCALEQHNGAWWIVRRDEQQTGSLIVHNYEWNGILNGKADPQTYVHTIGADDAIFFARESTEIGFERPHKSVQLTYNYEAPEEIVDNCDFERGEQVGGTDQQKQYAIEGWGFTLGNPTQNGAPVTNAYIRRTFEDGYEKDRYVVIEKGKPSGSEPHYLFSNPFTIGKRDKVSFSVDVAFGDNISSAGSATDYFAEIRMYGEDGTYWVLDDGSGEPQPGTWVQSDGNFFTNNRLIGRGWAINDTDETEWYTLRVQSRPAPVAGKVVVLLIQSSQFGNDTETRFANLQMDYQPYINGSYAKYSGHSHTFSQKLNYRAARSEQLMVSDSPKKLFKGALLKPSGGDYVLTGKWYDGAQFPNGLPPAQPLDLEKNLILVRHRNNVNNDADYSYVGWFVYLSEVVPEGYYLVGSNEAMLHDTSAYPPDPPMPIGAVPLSDLHFKGATQADVIENTRFSNHFFTNQSAFDVSANTILVTGLTTQSAYLMPYGKLVTLNGWNQYRNEYLLFDASLKGLKTVEGNVPGTVNIYLFNDSDVTTRNKYYILLQYTQNFYTCEWSGTFAEVLDITKGRVIDGDYVFRYVK